MCAKENQAHGLRIHHDVNVCVPFEFRRKRYTKVLGAFDRVYLLAIHKVRTREFILLKPCNREYVTFLGVEFHAPYFTPKNKTIEVILKDFLVIWATNLDIEDTVISKETNGASE